MRDSRAASAAAWLPAALLLLFALVRALSVELPYPLYPLLAFTPYAVPLCLLVAVWAMTLRRPVPAIAAAAAALVLGVLVAPRVLGEEQPAPSGPELRVLTSNLQFGAADVRSVAALAEAEGVDVLSLQELTPDAVAELRRTPLWRSLPHRVLDPAVGAFGAGLLSSAPLRRVPAPPTGEQPLLAAAVVAPGSARPIAEVWNVHPVPPTSNADVDELEAYLDAIPAAGESLPGAPRILAGDFNATLDDPNFTPLLGRGYRDAAAALGQGLEATWPADRTLPPLVAIDHVLGPESVAFSELSVHEITGSDHRAVVVTATLPAL